MLRDDSVGGKRPGWNEKGEATKQMREIKQLGQDESVRRSEKNKRWWRGPPPRQITEEGGSHSGQQLSQPRNNPQCPHLI